MKDEEYRRDAETQSRIWRGIDPLYWEAIEAYPVQTGTSLAPLPFSASSAAPR